MIADSWVEAIAITVEIAFIGDASASDARPCSCLDELVVHPSGFAAVIAADGSSNDFLAWHFDDDHRPYDAVGDDLRHVSDFNDHHGDHSDLGNCSGCSDTVDASGSYHQLLGRGFGASFSDCLESDDV